MARHQRVIDCLRAGFRQSTVRHGFVTACISFAIMVGVNALPM
jgi:hypothetical protein